MTTGKTLTQSMDLLHGAIARNRGADLLLPAAGSVHHHKSRFLTEDEGTLWIEAAPTDDGLINDLIESQENVTVAFRHHTGQLQFMTQLCQRQVEYPINSEMSVDALQIMFPTQLQEMPRRMFYRIPIFPNNDLNLRIWKMGTRANLHDRPLMTTKLNVELTNISMGGLGVIFRGTGGSLPPITPRDRLRIELAYHGSLILVQGQMRPPEPSMDRTILKTGIRFHEQQDDMGWRQTMARFSPILGAMQRIEMQRHWQSNQENRVPASK